MARRIDDISRIFGRVLSAENWEDYRREAEREVTPERRAGEPEPRLNPNEVCVLEFVVPQRVREADGDEETGFAQGVALPVRRLELESWQLAVETHPRRGYAELEFLLHPDDCGSRDDLDALNRACSHYGEIIGATLYDRNFCRYHQTSQVFSGQLYPSEAQCEESRGVFSLRMKFRVIPPNGAFRIVPSALFLDDGTPLLCSEAHLHLSSEEPTPILDLVADGNMARRAFDRAVMSRRRSADDFIGSGGSFFVPSGHRRPNTFNFSWQFLPGLELTGEAFIESFHHETSLRRYGDEIRMQCRVGPARFAPAADNPARQERARQLFEENERSQHVGFLVPPADRRFYGSNPPAAIDPEAEILILNGEVEQFRARPASDIQLGDRVATFSAAGDDRLAEDPWIVPARVMDARVSWDFSDPACGANPEQRSDWQKAREKALARSRELFLSLLSPRQRETFVKDHYVDVTGSRGGSYRIKTARGKQMNVYRVYQDRAVQKLCLHIDDRLALAARRGDGVGDELPLYDHLAAQLLILRTDEEGFLRDANHFECKPNDHWTASERAAWEDAQRERLIEIMRERESAASAVIARRRAEDFSSAVALVERYGSGVRLSNEDADLRLIRLESERAVYSSFSFE